MSDDPPRWQAETVPIAGAGAEPEPAPRSVFDPIEPRFDEVGELGRGGMGRVAEAVDRALARPVAVKYMLATDADAVARFEREVRITAQLQHPGIVPVLDAGRDRDGRPYYVMRRIDGVPLSVRVTGATVRDRLALVPALLAAIDAAAYAHARGIVHRDIKPSNILLGPFGETLLIDWGLARELDSTAREPSSVPPGDAGDLTRLGAAYGTPGFMSPEQARGEVADRRTDVYSLGASLYYVLSGTNPFPGSGPTQAIDRVAAGEALDLAAISDEVPAELTAIVAKAVAPDRDARYADAAELAADVRRFLTGQLVAAHRYTTGERIARWLRRHRLAASIAAIAIVTLAVGGVLSVTRILRERDRARTARAIAETRAEEAVLDRARSLIRVDPTSALAVVRTLPAASPRWSIAREIARAAVAGGVERLVVRHDGGVHAVAYSPGGTLAAAWFAFGSGTIEVFPRAGASRVVATHGASQLGWLDDHVLAAASVYSGSPGTVELIDTTMATITPVPVSDAVEIAFGERVVVIRTKDGSVRTADITGAVATLADGGIAAIDARAGRIAMLARDKLIVIEPDGTRRERVIDLPGAVYRVHLASGGTRIAAAVGGAKIEWASFDDPHPALYPSASTGLSGLVYAGDTLYGWSTVAGGVISFGDAGATPRWLASTEGTTGYYAAGGPTAAIVASSDGALAYAGAAGAFAIPHRPVAVRAIAIDAAGTEVAIGTTEGELFRLDLSGAVPALSPIPVGAELLAAGDDRLVVGSDPGTVQGFDLATPPAGSTPSLEIVDLGTGARHAIEPLGFGTVAWIKAGRVVLVGGRPLTGVITDLDGRVLYRAPVGSTALSDRAFVVETPSHDVARIDLADPAARPRVIAHVEGQIAIIETLDDRVAVSTLEPDGRFVAQLVDDRGSHALDLGTGQLLSSVRQTPDGTWWYVEDYATLWRRPASGVAVEVPVGQTVKLIEQDGATIIAVSDTTRFELAPDGTIARTTSIVGHACAVDHGSVLQLPDAIAVTMPDVNVRRLLSIGSAPQQARAGHDGRLIASVVKRLDGDHAIALWRDPVPADPHDLAAYIDRATNARLDPGSDQVLWDAPAK